MSNVRTYEVTIKLTANVFADTEEQGLALLDSNQGTVVKQERLSVDFISATHIEDGADPLVPPVSAETEAPSDDAPPASSEEATAPVLSVVPPLDESAPASVTPAE